MVYFQQQIGSPWFQKQVDAEKWLNDQENRRLNIDNIKRPNTKWVFVKFANLEVMAVFSEQPLLGKGPLPYWLRNLARGGHQMAALDTFDDNLCLWRCIAVYLGALRHRSTQAARELAKRYFQLKKAPANVPKTSSDELEKVVKHLNRKHKFKDWLGIRVYEPEPQQNGEILWHLRKNLPESLKKIITIGVYEGHAFLIKDIQKLAKLYACGHCQARFTKVCNLQRHRKTCSNGQTKIICPNKKVHLPLTDYEKSFYSKDKFSFSAISWLEQTSKTLGVHIHYVLCGQGGERWI